MKNPFVIKNNKLGSVKGFSTDREAGGFFWLGSKFARVDGIINEKNSHNISFVLLVVFLILFGRLFYVQVVRGSYYDSISEGNRIRQKRIMADRGIIYDRYGDPLVYNVPHYSIQVTPALFPDEDENVDYIIETLSEFVPGAKQRFMNESFLGELDSNSYNSQVLVDNISHLEALSIASIEDTLPGIELVVEQRRQYDERSGLSHVLGYVGQISETELANKKEEGYTMEDSIGKTGIEYYYEDFLHGEPGFREVEVDARGKLKKTLKQKEPVSGSGVYLTIDSDLQNKLFDSLSESVRQSETATGAVGVALDPRNGEVLALVSVPGFDNNFFSAGIQSEAYKNYLNDPMKPLFNRAISGTYPPGSTFKPVVGLAALEYDVIKPNKTFLSQGGLRIGQWFFPDWKAGGHGRVNITRAIAESVNTYFYYIGGGYSNFEGLGLESIVKFSKEVGLSSRLGIDLHGEVTGFLPTREWKEEKKGEPWYIGDTYHISIGQGDILVTPLQVASYTASIANGGTLFRPHLKRMVSCSSLSPESQDSYTINDNFASKENVEVIRKAMRETVLSGSARSLSYTLPVSSAGKTGTAQAGGDLENHAWFTGFAPYDNPSISLAILVEHGGEGSEVAVPVFRDIIDWYFRDIE